MPKKLRKTGLSEAAVKKLLSSTLTADDAKLLDIRSLTPQEVETINPTAAKIWPGLPALMLPYYNADGTPMRDNPEWALCPPYYRLRRLDNAPGSRSGQLDKDCPRYLQPPDTMPCVYYPRAIMSWEEVAANPRMPILITEGELKAAAACKAGFMTLGLGGVTAWRARKQGTMWVPSLDQMTFERRNVYIAFDSDALGNRNIIREIQLLTIELNKRGAITHLLTLPSIEGFDKVGLDDFLLHYGKSGPKQLSELIDGSQKMGFAGPLFDLSKRYVYVRDTGVVVNLRTMSKYKPDAFKDLEATRKWFESRLMKNGVLAMKEVSVSVEWLRWPLRHDVERITYAPGKEQITQDNEVNIWRGWGCEPKDGDVTPFLELIDFLFSASEPSAKTFFLRWLAYPIQRPGAKMFVAVLIHGVKQGTGKTLVGYTMSRVYGDNYALISHEDIVSSFNSWQKGKQFVHGDDVAGVDKRQDADKLKKMITQHLIRINEKYIPGYDIPDTTNFYFTSNHPNAAFLGDHDRRYLIIETPNTVLPNEFYCKYMKWLEEEGGAAYLFHYLLHLDLGDFNPHAPAPATAAKARMIEHSQSDVGSWCRHLLEAPDDVLGTSGEMSKECDLWTASQLLHFYDPSQRGKVTAGGIGRDLAAAGAHQVLGGRPIDAKGFKRERYWAIRNREHWSKVTSQTEVVAHLKKNMKTEKRRKHR